MFGCSTYCEFPYSTLTVEIRYINGDILYFTGTIDQILDGDHTIDQILNLIHDIDLINVHSLDIQQDEVITLNIDQIKENVLI